MTVLDVLQTFPQALNVLACPSNIGLKILAFVWSVHLNLQPGMTLSFQHMWPMEDNFNVAWIWVNCRKDYFGQICMVRFRCMWRRHLSSDVTWKGPICNSAHPHVCSHSSGTLLLNLTNEIGLNLQCPVWSSRIPNKAAQRLNQMVCGLQPSINGIPIRCAGIDGSGHYLNETGHITLVPRKRKKGISLSKLFQVIMNTNVMRLSTGTW